MRTIGMLRLWHRLRRRVRLDRVVVEGEGVLPRLQLRGRLRWLCRIVIPRRFIIRRRIWIRVGIRSGEGRLPWSEGRRRIGVRIRVWRWSGGAVGRRWRYQQRGRGLRVHGLRWRRTAGRRRVLHADKENRGRWVGTRGRCLCLLVEVSGDCVTGRAIQKRERERILKRDRPIWTHVQNTDQDEWDM